MCPASSSASTRYTARFKPISHFTARVNGGKLRTIFWSAVLLINLDSVQFTSPAVAQPRGSCGPYRRGRGPQKSHCLLILAKSLATHFFQHFYFAANRALWSP